MQRIRKKLPNIPQSIGEKIISDYKIVARMKKDSLVNKALISSDIIHLKYLFVYRRNGNTLNK